MSERKLASLVQIESISPIENSDNLECAMMVVIMSLNNNSDWFDKAMEQLDEDYERGLISDAEYQTEMRNLRWDWEDACKEEQEQVKGDYGVW